MKPKTQELLNIIKSTNNLDTYLADNENIFISKPVNVLLEEYITQKRISKTEVIQKSGLDRTYVYQIFQGIRTPSRDKILTILYATQANFEDIQKILKSAQIAPLYPFDKRDSVIIFALNNGYSLTDLNEILYDLGFELLE